MLCRFGATRGAGRDFAALDLNERARGKRPIHEATRNDTKRGGACGFVSLRVERVDRPPSSFDCNLAQVLHPTGVFCSATKGLSGALLIHPL
ncbi:MAG TPA: hypothetical protein VF708_04690 [Pyrinomonadaceae bacterium]